MIQGFTKKMYKDIKRFNRKEMENFIVRVYHQAYMDAVTVMEEKFESTIEQTKGCGPVMRDRLRKNWEGSE